MYDELKICQWTYNSDDRFTPGCVQNHGYRVNSTVKVSTYRYCPYCGRQLKVANPPGSVNDQ